MPTSPTPVVFIHGLWLHATSWQPWSQRFEEAGYAAVAPGWPGDAPTVEATRADARSVAGRGIDDVVQHYRSVIEGLDAAPVLVGHSFGGLIVQKLLAAGLGAAGVAIDAAPIKGVWTLPVSSLRSSFPVLRSRANRGRAVSLTREQFRYAFGNAVSAEEAAELHRRWTIPAPGKPLFQAASANFSSRSEAAVDTRRSDRGPLLLIAGGRDHTVPASTTRATARLYRGSGAVTDVHELADRGHSLTVDHGWLEVAESALAWLTAQGLASSAQPRSRAV